MNYEYVIEEIKCGWARCLSERPTPEKTPALLIGSGPTTDAIMPHLKNWKGAIFVSTSQASTAVYHGQGRLNIIAYDVQTQIDELARVDSWAPHEAELMLHPAMSPPFLRWWQGQRIAGARQKKWYYLPYMPNDPLRAEILPEMYNFINFRVLMSGSTGGMQLVLARLCGYDPIFTAGLDFGFPFGRTRFETWAYDHGKKAWQNSPGTKCKPEVKPGIDKDDESFMQEWLIGDNGVPTMAVHAFYKVQFLKMARMDMADRPKAQIIVATPGGLLDPQFPKIDCPLQEFIERQGQGFEHLYRTNAQMIEAYDQYLVQHGVYPIPVPDTACPDGMGVINLDSDDWEHDVPYFIDQNLRQESKKYIGMEGVTADPSQIDTGEVMQYFRKLKVATVPPKADTAAV